MHVPIQSVITLLLYPNDLLGHGRHRVNVVLKVQVLTQTV